MKLFKVYAIEIQYEYALLIIAPSKQEAIDIFNERTDNCYILVNAREITEIDGYKVFIKNDNINLEEKEIESNTNIYCSKCGNLKHWNNYLKFYECLDSECKTQRYEEWKENLDKEIEKLIKI